MTLYQTLGYYSLGAIGTFVWHQFIWSPPPYDVEWDKILAGGIHPWELKPNPKDRIATDIARSIVWPMYVPKVIFGSIAMLDEIDKKISKKL